MKPIQIVLVQSTTINDNAEHKIQRIKYYTLAVK